MSDAPALSCPSCGLMMVLTGTERGESGRPLLVHLYQCADVDCARRGAVFFEPATGGAVTAEEKTWVERVIARHGAFFPSDHTGSGGLRR